MQKATEKIMYGRCHSVDEREKKRKENVKEEEEDEDCTTLSFML